MKRPDRVEAGQWWHTQSQGLMRVAVGCVPAFEWFLDPTSSAEYLGSGENPEPSEWMIEALLAHAKEVAPKAADCYGADTVRHILNGGSTMSMDPRQGDAMNRAVLSLYRILRSLGKW